VVVDCSPHERSDMREELLAERSPGYRFAHQGYLLLASAQSGLHPSLHVRSSGEDDCVIWGEMDLIVRCVDNTPRRKEKNVRIGESIIGQLDSVDVTMGGLLNEHIQPSEFKQNPRYGEKGTDIRARRKRLTSPSRNAEIVATRAARRKMLPAEMLSQIPRAPWKKLLANRGIGIKKGRMVRSLASCRTRNVGSRRRAQAKKP
jgi:hypothetical protein